MRRASRWLLRLTAFLAGIWIIPHLWCERGADAWFDGDAALQGKLAAGVAGWVDRDLSTSDFQTGSDLFDGEWLFGSYLMAGLGFGQTAVEHPEWRVRHVALLDRCLDRLLSPGVRAFDASRWSNDPIDTLEDGDGHAAYLGYLNLVLGLRRFLDPAFPRAGLHDRITAALARRFDRAPAGLVETYPGEGYPVDNCAGIGSIGLHAAATGDARHRPVVDRWLARCRERWIDPATGLLFQAADPLTGRPSDAPRGSGTALAVYFLSFADTDLPRDLYAGLQRSLSGRFLGFGVVREYARGTSGRGDIDSGPIILGYGLSATGFALAGSRMHGDRETYRAILGTANLFGAPRDNGDAIRFVSGGPLGNAILFAMTTARPPGTWKMRTPEGPR